MIPRSLLRLGSSFVDINPSTGIIEVVLGGRIYFGTMFLIIGLTKEDFGLLKSSIRK
ncbi:MAG: hypothetical protein ABIJ58_02715 [Nanoarchaeota archaeon]